MPDNMDKLLSKTLIEAAEILIRSDYRGDLMKLNKKEFIQPDIAISSIEKNLLIDIGNALSLEDLKQALELGMTLADLQPKKTISQAIPKVLEQFQELEAQQQEVPQKPVELAIGANLGAIPIVNLENNMPEMQSRELEGLGKIIEAFKEYQLAQTTEQQHEIGSIEPPSTPNPPAKTGHGIGR